VGFVSELCAIKHSYSLSYYGYTYKIAKYITGVPKGYNTLILLTLSIDDVFHGSSTHVKS